MTPSWPEVNAAVLAVLSEFGRSRRPADRPSNGHRDVFVGRLFSLRHAEAVGDEHEVRIASGTVVTPLALDLLKRRWISLRIVSSREAARSRSHHQGEWGFAIESRSGQVEAIRRNLLEEWVEIGPDSVEAARWVVDGNDRGAFVVTDEASVSAWRAGRVVGIRAAAVADPEAVSRAIRHLGANLIVVEASGKSIYLLKQIGERFRKGGAPILPEWLEMEAPR